MDEGVSWDSIAPPTPPPFPTIKVHLPQRCACHVSLCLSGTLRRVCLRGGGGIAFSGGGGGEGACPTPCNLDPQVTGEAADARLPKRFTDALGVVGQFVALFANSRALYAAGHSLGGTLAAFAAYHFPEITHAHIFNAGAGVRKETLHLAPALLSPKAAGFFNNAWHSSDCLVQEQLWDRVTHHRLLGDMVSINFVFGKEKLYYIDEEHARSPWKVVLVL